MAGRVLSEAELGILATELVMKARAAVLDCRTPPVTEWVMGLDDGQARQLLQATAFLAGALAVQLGGSAHQILAGFTTLADSSRTQPDCRRVAAGQSVATDGPSIRSSTKEAPDGHS